MNAQNQKQLRTPQRVTAVEVVYLIALLALAYGLGSALISFAEAASGAIRFAFPISYQEGVVLDQVSRLAGGGSLRALYSTGLGEPPYVITTTTPLFQMIQTLFWQHGVPSLWIGRAISTGSAVAAAAALFILIRSLTKDWVAAITAGGLLLCFPNVVANAPLFQVDTLALALSLAGLCVIVRFKGSLPALAAAVLLLASAGLTKQSYAVAGPVTAAIWVAIEQGPKRGALFALAMASVTGGLGAALNAATGGGLWLNLSSALSGPSELLIGNLLNVTLHAWLVLVGGMTYLIMDRLGERSRAWPLVLSYLLVTFVAAIVTRSETAASMFELIAALCLLAGATVARAGSNLWVKSLLLGVLALLQISGLSAWYDTGFAPAMSQKLTSARDIADLSRIVAKNKGNVLADEFMGLLPQQGYPVLLQPLEFRRLGDEGQWSDAALIQRIQRKEFGAILLFETAGERTITLRWSPEVRKAIYANYQTTQSYADTLVYEPIR